MAEHVTVLGAGTWGLACARLLEKNSHAVTLWAYDPREYQRLILTRGDYEKLPGFSLGEAISISNDLEASLSGAKLVVLAVPAQHLRSVLRNSASFVASDSGVVNLAKGVETSTLKRMSEVVREEWGDSRRPIATLSGPSHAEEVAVDMPTTVVVASSSIPFAQQIQELFAGPTFRVYTSDDVIGVELGGSLKNVIAIASGMVDGLGFGDNTKGALITRGLAEMMRLGLALGARAETFAGLSGLGDLVATCTSRHSRNRWVGEQIGKGRKLHEVLLAMSMVAEGVETARSARDLAHRVGVEMPITEEVFRVLFEGKPPQAALGNLMGRTLKAEVWQ
jgi:glycerol-3-phosphate dehydrogenase (NAD(P)+)